MMTMKMTTKNDDETIVVIPATSPVASGGPPRPADREEFLAWIALYRAGREAEQRIAENRPYENTMDGDTFAARYLHR
jgi:hypothetical protein